MSELNEEKLHEFVGKMLGDLGGAMSIPTARIGFRLGLFDALHEGGPATPAELAERAGGLTERYVREWALAQASNGFVTYDAATGKFSLSPEQAMVFAVKDSPVYLAGGFDLAISMVESEDKVEGPSAKAAASTGAISAAACSARSGPSSGRTVSIASCRNGFPPSTGSRTS
ncbi:MAG: hypothetical protein U5K56_10240 [Halioglobus sp.]|nr:hypothetical protein [Halioglobus sp.]